MVINGNIFEFPSFIIGLNKHFVIFSNYMEFNWWGRTYIALLIITLTFAGLGFEGYFIKNRMRAARFYATGIRVEFNCIVVGYSTGFKRREEKKKQIWSYM